jgi:hypothetical protein
MCSDNLDLETTTKTFMFHAHPIPLCPWHPWNGFATRVVWRVQKNAFLRRSRFVSCVHTQVHMTVCLFDLTCLHVTCTNKNLDNERVTTFLTYTSSWSVRTFLNQDGVSNDRETFSHVMKIYERACAHTKTIQIALQRELFWTLRRTTGLAVSHYIYIIYIYILYIYIYIYIHTHTHIINK